MTILLALGGLVLIAGLLLVRRKPKMPEPRTFDEELHDFLAANKGAGEEETEEISVCSYSADDPIYGTRIRVSKPVRKD